MANNVHKNVKAEGVKYSDFLKSEEKEKYLQYKKNRGDGTQKKDSSKGLN